MAFSQVITSWISGYSSNGTNMTLPIASFSDLTAAEAHTTTGDIRQLYYAMCSQFYNAYIGKAEADRPTRMTLQKNVGVNTVTNQATVTFSFTFTCSTGVLDVIAE